MGNTAACGKGDRRWESTGTSFAAAVTSGLAALLVSRMGHGRPDQIREMIEKSADDLGQPGTDPRSEEHTSELQSRLHLVCRLLLEKKKEHSNLKTAHSRYVV